MPWFHDSASVQIQEEKKNCERFYKFYWYLYCSFVRKIVKTEITTAQKYNIQNVCHVTGLAQWAGYVTGPEPVRDGANLLTKLGKKENLPINVVFFGHNWSVNIFN